MGPFIDIKGFEGRYKIDPYGNIISVARDIFNKDTGVKTGSTKERWLKFKTSGEYPRVCLSMGGKHRFFLVHRLVAEHFIPNPHNYPIVNHKDGNKDNYELTNLEWCTQKHNQDHAYATGLRNRNAN